MSVITSVVGFPRIGAQRELKKAIECYWKGQSNVAALRATAQELRSRHWRLQAEAGIDLIPSNDFSYYDQMLDTAVMLGLVPNRYQDLGLNEEDTLFAMARGYQGSQGDVTALAMKKWFTTNYHYLVPELDSSTTIALSSSKPFDEFQEAKALGIHTKPVLIGPYTFLKLTRGPRGEQIKYDDQVVEAVSDVYAHVIRRFIDLGASWVQFDEPYLVLDKGEEDINLLRGLYSHILPARHSTRGSIQLLIQTYFGHIADCYEVVTHMGFDAIGLDFVEGGEDNLAVIQQVGVHEDTSIVAGVVSGRNIWKNNYTESLKLIDSLQELTPNLVLSTSASLLHVPLSVQAESELAPEVRDHLAFAIEKLGELHDLAYLTQEGNLVRQHDSLLTANQKLWSEQRVCTDVAVQNRLARLKPEDYIRQPSRSSRQPIQRQRLGLPILPTTTIGSFPQTNEIRSERARFSTGEIDSDQYNHFIAQRIDHVIELQEQLGIDVLVHGEFERNDMVEYFGQQLNGFLFTQNAWVQSYGTRCVKPPVIWSDISRSKPMTVRWSAYAQSRTKRLVKGMLTGPVTIFNWSWPREDISPQEQTQQLALAIRDEVLDLEAAGIRIIQIDEAALREKLPLRHTDWHKKYLDWAIPAFRLVHSGVKATTQIHTHMCYSEFNDIISDIDAMDADVISFEASRSDLTVLDAIEATHFETEAGPGVYDIHSPRIPSQSEIEERIRLILRKMSPTKVWINPDCGLKTRSELEAWPSIEHMVAAAHRVRAEVE
ncbi:5-methyltetrahydropteroyltriglutamate--homocysteine S-methyltransferase [Bombiscardovia coagulans]|uniref:5-methyltetrahydropteroyltriglutamate--homocysteine methyltransferase n=1 Tax=Bombiscardovia coagulans TaxID=686666 RepID=A0A261EVQ8_9BIFI|nr:5-methyltetrahydropteroyltriglutamate--homocysteine S-methyltransferase [Bombiscardovia coagulans]OZG50933.1 5-methyltetrahydropteroyltriglutamate-- homocyste ine methyltransferase [Bombiscardovia coagulans]